MRVALPAKPPIVALEPTAMIVLPLIATACAMLKARSTVTILPLRKMRSGAAMAAAAAPARLNGALTPAAAAASNERTWRRERRPH